MKCFSKYAVAAVVCLAAVTVLSGYASAAPWVDNRLLLIRQNAIDHSSADFLTTDLQLLDKKAFVDLTTKKVKVTKITTGGTKTTLFISKADLDALVNDNNYSRVEIAREPQSYFLPKYKDGGNVGYQVKPMLDASIPDIRQNQMWAKGYEGQGVIIGIIDTGIDWLHKDFRKDKVPGDGEKGSRILYLCDQNYPDNTNTCGGTVVNQAYIESAIAANPSYQDYGNDYEGHGTHVTGIAAGDGSESNSLYKGMAPQADIIFVATDFSDEGILKGIDWIFEKAGALNKPVVINLSLGSDASAFAPNGLTRFDQEIQNRIKPNGVYRNYKAIIVANGNEHEQQQYKFSSTTVTGDVTINFTGSTWVNKVTADNALDGSFFKIWKGFKVKLRLKLPNGTYCPNSNWVMPGTVSYCRFFSGASEGSIGVESDTANDSYISKYGAIVGFLPDNNQVDGFSAVIPTGNYTLEVRALNSGDGSDTRSWLLMAVNYDTNPTTYGFNISASDHNYTVNSPADCLCVIGVGAYTTKNTWVDKNGQSHTALDPNGQPAQVGNIAYFSSYGPTAFVEQLKPNITAPGHVIVSAKSRDAFFPAAYVISGDKYVVLSGTSMATPHVVGAVATMMQRKKAKGQSSYDQSQIKSDLELSAETDTFTGTQVCSIAYQNSFKWGCGKLDTYKIANDFPGLSAPIVVIPADAEKNLKFEVYSLNGRKLDATFDSKTMSVLSRERLANGVYLLIKIDTEGKRQIFKFVVKR